MPTSFESYYFMYDPDYAYLSLGVCSVKWEMDFINEKRKHFPSFKYYTPGAYIHTTGKMNYKINYQPMEVLCPITYTWQPFTKNEQKQLWNKIQKTQEHRRMAP